MGEISPCKRLCTATKNLQRQQRISNPSRQIYLANNTTLFILGRTNAGIDVGDHRSANPSSSATSGTTLMRSAWPNDQHRKLPSGRRSSASSLGNFDRVVMRDKPVYDWL